MDIQALLQTICNVYYGSSQTYSALLQARKLLENKDLDILKFAQDNITLSLKNSHNRRLFEFISNFSEKYSPLDYHSNQFHFFLEYFSKFSNPQFFKKSQEMQMLGCVLSLEIHDGKILPIQDIQTELTYKDGHYYINTKQDFPKYSTNINDKYTHAIIFAKVKDNQQNESLIQPVIVKLKGLKGIQIQNLNNNPYRSIITLDNIIIKPENILKIQIPNQFRGDIFEFVFAVDRLKEFRQLILYVIRIYQDLLQQNILNQDQKFEIQSNFTQLLFFMDFLNIHKKKLMILFAMIKSQFKVLKVAMKFQQSFEAFILKNIGEQTKFVKQFEQKLSETNKNVLSTLQKKQEVKIQEIGDLDKCIINFGHIFLGEQKDIQKKHVIQFCLDNIQLDFNQQSQDYIKAQINDYKNKERYETFYIFYRYNFLRTQELHDRLLEKLQNNQKIQDKEYLVFTQDLINHMISNSLTNNCVFQRYRSNNKYLINIVQIFNKKCYDNKRQIEKYPEQDELNINDVVKENHIKFSEIFDNVINSLLGEPKGIQQNQNSFQQNPKL